MHGHPPSIQPKILNVHTYILFILLMMYQAKQQTTSVRIFAVQYWNLPCQFNLYDVG